MTSVTIRPMVKDSCEAKRENPKPKAVIVAYKYSVVHQVYSVHAQMASFITYYSPGLMPGI